ncbi:MAG: GDSL-type esterase/lipase family protein [Lachnospiraceae bacterium]|nr:GDSL-type esterase/lipase family protein [Lachnospiraceae bacterium]
MESKKIKNNGISISEIILSAMVLLVCLAIFGYSIFLKMIGGEENVKFSELMADATNNIHEGIYPWNYANTYSETDFQLADAAGDSMDAFYHMYYNKKGDATVSSRVPVGKYGVSFNDGLMSEINIYELDSLSISGMEAVIDQAIKGVSENSAGIIASTEPIDFTTVDDSYFDDAVFIGDSRMVGVSEYAGIDNACFLGKTAMTIYSMMDEKCETDPERRTVREVLESESFGKIYIMVGINEVGTGDVDYFVDHYVEVLNEIRELQPNAIIFVQAIMHVSHDMDMSGSYINNTAINDRNQGLSQLANGTDIFYIDVNPLFDDEYGALVKAYTWDDVHLYATHYTTWHEFYLQHGIVLP